MIDLNTIRKRLNKYWFRPPVPVLQTDDLEHVRQGQGDENKQHQRVIQLEVIYFLTSWLLCRVVYSYFKLIYFDPVIYRKIIFLICFSTLIRGSGVTGPNTNTSNITNFFLCYLSSLYYNFISLTCQILILNTHSC